MSTPRGLSKSSYMEQSMRCHETKFALSDKRPSSEIRIGIRAVRHIKAHGSSSTVCVYFINRQGIQLGIEERLKIKARRETIEEYIRLDRIRGW